MPEKLNPDSVEYSGYKVVPDDTRFEGVLYSEGPDIRTIQVVSTNLRCNVVYPDGTKCPWLLPLNTPLPMAYQKFGDHNRRDHGGLFIARLRYGHQIVSKESTLNDPKSGHTRRGWSRK